MATLDNVFLLFRAWAMLAKRTHAYIRWFDDFSGGLFCYDDIEITTWDDIPEAYESFSELIRLLQ